MFPTSLISPSHGFAATAADCGGPLCHFVTSPHTVGSHPLGKGASVLRILTLAQQSVFTERNIYFALKVSQRVSLLVDASPWPT